MFRTTSATLGERLRRIPDGETGIRSGWIGWQFQLFASHPMFEVVAPPPNTYAPRSRLKLRSPRRPTAITFEQLGYADAALDSYRLFFQLKREGVIPAQYSFQVCLPTPLAPISAFIIKEDQAEVELAYEAALLNELAKITAHTDVVVLSRASRKIRKTLPEAREKGKGYLSCLVKCKQARK